MLVRGVLGEYAAAPHAAIVSMASSRMPTRGSIYMADTRLPDWFPQDSGEC